mmetsp:Transcript_7967/g.19967  ORF Transcript_7967/g.19967 Transcript_7967/m.19967 type:complete len:378 (-) Transcript_7967:122-1255(-)
MFRRPSMLFQRLQPQQQQVDDDPADDTIVLGRCLMFLTTIALISGYSSIAVFCCSVPVFYTLKGMMSTSSPMSSSEHMEMSTTSPTKISKTSSSFSSKIIQTLVLNEHYWMVCFGSFVLSLMSLFCLEVYGRTSTKFWVLGLAVQKVLGAGLMYLLYIDLGLGSSTSAKQRLHNQMSPHEESSSSSSGSSAADRDGRNSDSTGGDIRSLELHIKILEGRNLVPKDQNIWGRKISSDPYVKIYHGSTRVGRTNICFKTLNPRWESSSSSSSRNNSFHLQVLPKVLDAFPTVDCQIWDHDHLSSDDSMGVCSIPVPVSLNRKETKWIPVHLGGEPGDKTYCHNATGALKVEIEVTSRLCRGFQKELCKTASQRGGFLLD